MLKFWLGLLTILGSSAMALPDTPPLRRCFIYQWSSGGKYTSSYNWAIYAGETYQNSTKSSVSMSSPTEVVAWLEKFQEEKLCPPPDKPNNAKCLITGKTTDYYDVQIVHPLSNWSSNRTSVYWSQFENALKFANRLNELGQCTIVQLGE